MTPTEDMIIAGQSRLKAADRRITPQRKLVLDILANAAGHLDAGEIYARARQHDPRLSLSTVYRTLSALKESGAVRELHLDEEHRHYELETDDEHSHLVCVRCGRVVEIDSAVFAGVAGAAAQAHGFRLASAQVELTGVCADCQQQEA